MKVIINLISSSFLAGWIITMAVFSIQKINPGVLRFFTWESLKLPIGVLLAFCVGLGLVLGSLLPLLLPKPKKYPRQRLSDVDVEDMEEFNF